MNRRKLLLAAPALILPRKAEAIWSKLSTFSPVAATCPFGTGLGDGCPASPSGTPQYPTLLNSGTISFTASDGSTVTRSYTYATRPSWNVAGVDYHVGIDSSVTLRDPWPGFPGTNSTDLHADLQARNVGWENTSNGTLICNGAGTTIENFDFSLHGGLNLHINANNITVKNNNIKFGTFSWKGGVGNTNTLINVDGFNATITQNIIDGNGAFAGGTGFAYGVGSGQGVNFGGGDITITYNWMKNAPNNFFVSGQHVSGGVSHNYEVAYNVLDNCSCAQGAGIGVHGEFWQVINDLANLESLNLHHNLFLQSLDASGTWTPGVGTGTVTFPSSMAVLAATYVNNCFIYLGIAEAFWPVMIDTTFLNGAATVTNNFYDNSGSSGGLGPQLVIGNTDGGMPASGPFSGTINGVSYATYKATGYLTSGNINILTNTVMQ